MFIGKTGAEAEAPILWPPAVKRRLIGKDPDAGEDPGLHRWLNGEESACQSRRHRRRGFTSL